MDVSALGYLGFEVSDLAAWRIFATDFLGLMDVSESADSLKLRLDSRDWRIAVREGARDDLVFAGFEVADPGALDGLAARLASLGVETRPEPALAKKRGVTALLSCTDPSGLRVELYCGATEAFDVPMISPAGVRGFVTDGQGLGHIVLYAADVKKTLRFYMEGLGFRLSDHIDMPFGPAATLELTFLHCNPRHHTIAIAPVPSPKHMNHFMVQAQHMEDVGFAYDRAEKLGLKIANTLGRHTNDHMFSFYTYTPSGFEVEFGWGARSIGPDWTVTRHKATSTWGHKRLPGN
ncbi:MAG TPA: VOC family protein [Rhizomicrobium sp.]|nr:VOC family protein [Rhizomicrobium sp.]